MEETKIGQESEGCSENITLLTRIKAVCGLWNFADCPFVVPSSKFGWRPGVVKKVQRREMNGLKYTANGRSRAVPALWLNFRQRTETDHIK